MRLILLNIARVSFVLAAMGTEGAAPFLCAQTQPSTAPNQATAPSNALPNGGFSESLPSSVRKPLPLPKTSRELLQQLTDKSNEIQMLIDDGALPQIWTRAMDAKDLILGFDDYLNEVPAASRPKVSVAILNGVTSSWNLEAFGDLGDKQKVLEAHRVYAAAVADIKEAYGKAR